MKEIDELREALQSCRRTENTEHPFDTYWITARAADVLIDAIEQAIAERYMELPVDADGVPIHVVDTMVPWNGEGETVVAAVCGDGLADECVPMHYAPNMHHAKPRTVEDVLADLVMKTTGINAHSLDDGMPYELDALIAEYAGRIEMMVRDDR